MEKRTILAVVLAALLAMAYQILFVKPPEPQPPAPTQKKDVPPPASAPPVSPGPAAPSVAAPITPKEAPAVPERKAVVEAPLYRAVVSSQGGRLEAWDLNYRGQKPMVNGDLGPRGLTVSRSGGPARAIAFAVSPDSLVLSKGADQGEVKLVGEDGFGLRITETLRFRADSYVVEHEIKVENRHTVAQSADIMLGWTAPVEWPKDRDQRFQGQHPIRTVRLVGGSAQREDLAKVGSYQGPGAWVGRELPACRGEAHRKHARREQALRDGGGRAARYPPLPTARGVLGRPGLDLYWAQGIREVEGGGGRAREVDLLRRLPAAPGLRSEERR